MSCSGSAPELIGANSTSDRTLDICEPYIQGGTASRPCAQGLTPIKCSTRSIAPSSVSQAFPSVDGLVLKQRASPIDDGVGLCRSALKKADPTVRRDRAPAFRPEFG